MTLPPPTDWPVTDPVCDSSRDLLRQRVEATPDSTALVDADLGGEVSYEAFDRRASEYASVFSDRFESEDGRLGLLLGTRPAFASIYFAAGRLGTSVVVLNVELPAERLQAQVTRADIDHLVCGSATEELAQAVAPDDVPVASVDESTKTGIESLGARENDDVRSSETGLDAERLVMFTSGTSGEPKGVRLTHQNLVASAVGSAHRLGVGPNDRWLVCLPMYHMGGLAPLVRSTLYGTTTVIQREFDPESTARVMDEFDVTGVSLVPTMLTRLLDAGWSPSDSLRFVLLGGAPASRELIERCEERDVPASPTYGMTETASQVATATPEEAREHPETVGTPLLNTTVTVQSSDGTPTDPGSTGELVVDGPTVTPGYLDDAQTAAAFDEGGFHTGDLGHADDAGRLWVVGRVDDAIVTGGEKVHPARVADALRELDSVADAAVVGLADDEWGKRVAALVVPAGAASTAELLTATQAREGVRDRLATYAVPKTVGFADSIPRTHSGTVDREAVRERLRDERES